MNLPQIQNLQHDSAVKNKSPDLWPFKTFTQCSSVGLCKKTNFTNASIVILALPFNLLLDLHNGLIFLSTDLYKKLWYIEFTRNQAFGRRKRQWDCIWWRDQHESILPGQWFHGLDGCLPVLPEVVQWFFTGHRQCRRTNVHI